MSQPSEAATNARLVIVSNREPYKIQIKGKEVWLEKTPGGLISALDPVLKKRGGLWICWEGTPQRIEHYDGILKPKLDDETAAKLEKLELPYDVKTVALSESEINHYYYGYANTRIWPLFHYFISHCNFLDQRDWVHYFSANQKFADTVVQETTDEDWVWVQDYHLFLVPDMVRQKAPNRKLALFSHIPFPSYETFRILPHREVLLKGMLGSDLIGFHVPEYVDYFLDCVDKLLVKEGITVDFDAKNVTINGRVVHVRPFPISIDYQAIHDKAGSPAFQHSADALKVQHGVRYLGIGVDRLDYSKGLLERLEAIYTLFIKYPQYRNQLTFVQVAAPTRTEVDTYRQMRDDVNQIVGRINGQLSEKGWSPIQYFNRSLPLDEIIPYYMASDFALVTPLRDGMNLVAKEYCAAKEDNSGTLILSELAGSAAELEGSEVVNPYNVEQVADRIHAILQADPVEKQQKMKKLRQYIKHHDIHHWVQAFLEAFQEARQAAESRVSHV